MRKIVFILILIAVLQVGCALSPQIADLPPAEPSPLLPTPTAPPSPTAAQAAEAPADEPTATPAPESPPLFALGDLCNHPYYPIVDGQVRQYNSLTYTGDSLTSSATVTYTTHVGPDQTFEIELQSSAQDLVLLLKGQCGPEGITLYEATPPGVPAEGEEVMPKITTSGISLPIQMNVGDSWTQQYQLEGTFSMESETTRTALGFESVTVPAGTYRALKVKQVDVITMNAGPDNPSTMTFTQEQWYVEGIGAVKWIANLDEEGSSYAVFELISID